MLGFASDEGVRRNKGRRGAAAAPDAIRRLLANMAAHSGHHNIVDYGTLTTEDDDLESMQSNLATRVTEVQKSGQCTLVLGGGHETAYAHGLGLYEAHPEAKVGIINFDAHLDLRTNDRSTSGTPFRQLHEYCMRTRRPFNYMVIGASLASNTVTLANDAKRFGVKVIWDTCFMELSRQDIEKQVTEFINGCDVLYLTIDLDVLPAWQMPGVSAPASLGVSIDHLLPLITKVCHASSLRAVDLVEYNPSTDIQQIGGRLAARIAWHILHHWERVE
ncbi:hypothetical protein SAMD00019534_092790 [Acytostelium subglobosum LB1]|uniref:hypothetical protein n=1 Tax=Acytostelium subglobosum LB1 TaxID=1410327 RepID=UPI0006447E3B|nr:hypothetical protein SAMD00019534_092790 [Acytostelium subglobosum LB1]GAM26104.1 hypothetical protein SAMD00019534_092790 [Acytostelium subglobosum LB1]|eukprot:XP_012751147.1 hypothetical protein SAMD00019534_092790 [Acytostelium subglobosum LB1]